MDIKDEIKKVIIDSLALEDITEADIKDAEPLFNEGLGLDSIDALELAMALKKHFNLNIGQDKDINKKHFYSVDTLAKFIEGQQNG